MTTFSINRTVGYGTRNSAVGARMRENLNTVTHGDKSQLERIRSSLDEPKADAVSSGMGSDGISGGEMTGANYSELCAEHLVGVSLVEAISNAIRRAQKACPTLDTGLFEDALSDFRGGLSTLNDELTAHEEGQF